MYYFNNYNKLKNTTITTAITVTTTARCVDPVQYKFTIDLHLSTHIQHPPTPHTNTNTHTHTHTHIFMNVVEQIVGVFICLVNSFVCIHFRLLITIYINR